MWAAKWKSKNELDGTQEYLIRRMGVVKLFKTRKDARAFIKHDYGYIKTRKDLRAEPHGWRTPTPIKVDVITLDTT